MKARGLFSATLAAIVCTLLFSFPSLVRAAPDAPARRAALGAATAEADTLLKKGDAPAAYAAYMRLWRAHPDDDAVNLGLARSATAAKRWNQAVIAYETLIEKYPREAGLYSELANVYMLLGDRASAERSLAVLRSLDGKSAQADTDKALDILESRYDDLQIHGKLRAGFLYDSNVNLGPRSEDMDLGNLPVRVRDAEEKESLGMYLGADLDLGLRVARDSPWWIVGDLRAFWRGNAASGLQKIHNRESQWLRGAAGVRHLTSHTLTEARVKAEIFDYEFYQNVSAIGPEATFLWAVTPEVHLISKGGIDRRIYSRDPGRNGTYGWIGEYARFFFAEANHEFTVGGRYIGAAADRKDYSYEGWEASARFLFKLPWGFELEPFVGYTKENYRGPATVLERSRRQDERLRLGSNLTYRIDEAWSLEFTWQYTDNNSNSRLYKYDQHFVSGGVAWSF